MKRVVLYPGSFDPFTLGHLDIVKRLAVLYDEVVVAVLVNPFKSSFLSTEERLQIIQESTRDFDNVTVMSGQGATVALARQVGAQAIARGLRSVTDFEYENTLAAGNHHLAPEIETIFLLARPEYGFVSSTLVREICSLGGDLASLVPPCAVRTMMNRTHGKEK